MDAFEAGSRTVSIGCYHELKSYRTAFRLQQKLYTLSRSWPREEMHSLTSRLLRSARSIGADLAQLWSRRPEPEELQIRLRIVDAEIAETTHWLDTAHSCGYLDDAEYDDLRDDCRALSRMLAAMSRACQRIPAVVQQDSIVLQQARS